MDKGAWVGCLECLSRLRLELMITELDQGFKPRDRQKSVRREQGHSLSDLRGKECTNALLESE
jgi:hypothetical protein